MQEEAQRCIPRTQSRQILRKKRLEFTRMIRVAAGRRRERERLETTFLVGEAQRGGWRETANAEVAACREESFTVSTATPEVRGFKCCGNCVGVSRFWDYSCRSGLDQSMLVRGCLRYWVKGDLTRVNNNSKVSERINYT